MTEDQKAIALHIPRAALTEFIDKFCCGDSSLSACAEAAFFAFNQHLAALAEQSEPVEEIYAYVKGIYEHLESTLPAGAAKEIFRLPVSATGAQQALFDYVSGNGRGERTESSRQDSEYRRADCSPIEAPAPPNPSGSGTRCSFTKQ